MVIDVECPGRAVRAPVNRTPHLHECTAWWISTLTSTPNLALDYVVTVKIRNPYFAVLNFSVHLVLGDHVLCLLCLQFDSDTTNQHPEWPQSLAAKM